MLAYSAIVLSLAASVYGQAATTGATIDSPSALITCQPVALRWSGGQAPYFLNILPGSSPTAAALVQLGQQTGTSFTWTVNVAAGTSVSLAITDSSGVTNYSSPVTIQAGSSTECVGEDVDDDADDDDSTAAAGGTTAAAGTTTRAGTTAATTRASTTGGSAAPAATSAPATGGAASNAVSAAGVLAAVAVVLAL